jgi:hypothetical protein
MIDNQVNFKSRNAKPAEKQGRKAADLTTYTRRDGRATEGCNSPEVGRSFCLSRMVRCVPNLSARIVQKQPQGMIPSLQKGARP